MPRYQSQHFLTAAGLCFRRYGLFRTRMEGIAAEVPCSKVTLYKHFPDRTTLAGAWLAYNMTRSREAVATILGSDIPFSAKIKQLIQQKQRDLTRLGDAFTRDLFSLDCPDALRSVLNEQIALNKAQTAWMIQLGRDEGVIHPSISDALVTLLLDHFEHLFTDPAFLDAVLEGQRIDTLVSLFLYGVHRHPSLETPE